MSQDRLHPRLLHPTATVLFERICEELYEAGTTRASELGGSSDYTDQPVVWAATGPPRILASELDALREATVATARAHGFPAPRPRDEQLAALDRALARVWLDHARLFPAEAAMPEIWSFHALVLLPDVAFWRFPARPGETHPNRERFVGSDLTRHVFGRLWWRAAMVTIGTDEVDEGFDLLGALGEADVDQILSRRTAYGGSPVTFRAILRTWREQSALPPLSDLPAGVSARDVLRDALKRLLRRGAFIALDLLDEAAIGELVGSALEESLRHLTGELQASPGGSGPAQIDHDDTNRPTDPDHFDELPLSELCVRIAELVAEKGELGDEELAAALQHRYELSVPRSRNRIIRGIAWMACVLGYVERDEAGRCWRPGQVRPAPDRRWGEWTMNSIREQAGVLAAKDGDLLDLVVAQLFTGRPNKTVKLVARTAVAESGRAA